MFIFRGNDILHRGGSIDFERPKDVIRCSEDMPKMWQELEPWCEVDESFDAERAVSLGGTSDVCCEWLGLRELWRKCGTEPFERAGGAWQYMNWWRNVRLCSFCGEELTASENDRGRRCPKCGRTFYAPQSPAIIVAVEREGKLLLAHNALAPAGRFSVIAGFVEPGETLEQTVAREVKEETGVDVHNIKYFGSQSWPFPCSLMLGFTAEWAGSEIKVDGVEIAEADWFAPDAMPQIPDAISISRRLIDNFINTHKSL